jgi:phage anti-repressor protein
MAKMHLIRIIFLLLLPVLASAQKIKYKEVFNLLNTKQYELAEPFLRKYIEENGTKAEPSSYLFMGIIYQEKSTKDDVLRETETAQVRIDSALYFFDQAFKTINEKEFRGSSKDYYSMYSKRDLRSGEFGVKLSDVQFDIEKRTAALRERKDKVKMVKHYFTEMEQHYKQSHGLFGVIQKAFPGEREFYLRADETTLRRLDTLAQRYEASYKAFEHYKISAGNLGKIGYNHEWNASDIKDFKSDGQSLPDFYQSDLKVWDYKKFADNAIATINTEIKPIQENLVKYDIEINKLHERIKVDSVSVKSDLTKLVENLLGEKLKKFDADPLPLSVMAVKVADLEYKSTLLENKKSDSASNVFVRLDQTKQELADLRKLDSLLTRLLAVNIDEEALNYAHFVSQTYNSGALLKAYIKTKKEYADRERRQKEADLTVRQNALNWLVVGSDSIPLGEQVTASAFKPKVIEPEKYTAGLDVKDSVKIKGYFYTVTPTRIPDVKVNFPVDNSWVTNSNLNLIKGLATKDEGDHIYFVLVFHSTPVEGKYKASLAKVYRSDGLSWSHNFTFDFAPQSLEYQQDTGELVVKSGEVFVIVDKTGKTKQS